jgi:N-acetylmuramoyl-L-alanine amidase
VKKLIASSVLATATLFPILTHAEDTKFPVNLVTNKEVEIRTGATSAYKLIESLKSGETATVISEFENSLGEYWYRVDLGNAKGWALAANFNVPNDSSILPGMTATITGNYVNIRSGATTAYKVVTQLMNGKKVKIIDQFQNSANELWYRIDTGSEQGWVIKDFLKVNTEGNNPPPPVSNETKVIEIDKATIHSGATKAYKTLKTVNKGDKLTIKGEFTNSANEKWYNVQTGQITGWIYEAAFIKAPVSPPPVTEEKKVLTKGNIRSGASDAYKVVGSVSPNEIINIVSTFTNSIGEKWYRVSKGNTVGWVRELVFIENEAPPTPPPSELPNKGDVVYLNKFTVSIRSGASNGYRSVLDLPVNSAIEVVDHFHNSLGEDWLRVKSGSIIGWINSIDVQATPLSVKNLFVNVPLANLRSGPSLNDAVVDQASSGTVLKAIDQSGDWYKALTLNNEVVWVHNSVVTDKPMETNVTKYTSASSAYLRSGASDQYKIVETLRKNTKITVLQYFTNSLGQEWLQVKAASGKTGWILNSQTSFESSNNLTSPIISGQLVTWIKPTDLTLKYTTLSDNRLKIYGDIGKIDIPKTKINGIKTIENINNSLILTFEPGYTFTYRHYKDKISVKVLPTGLLGKKIIIDAGHGGKDVGAVGPSGILEKNITLSSALALKEELERGGAIVQLTRSTDVFLELSERTYIANASDYDAFVSLHADAFSSTSKGSTTFYNTTVNYNGPRSKTMADSVQKNLISALGTYNRGVKEQEFYVNRMNELPSILVELAFLSNPKEEALLNSPAFRQKAATGIRKGLEEYFSNF